MIEGSSPNFVIYEKGFSLLVFYVYFSLIAILEIVLQ